MPKFSSTDSGATILSKLNNTTITLGMDTGADYVCDGTADNVQIQAAIDFLDSLGGGKLIVHEGTYDIQGTGTTPTKYGIGLRSNIAIIGAGRNKTIFKQGAGQNCNRLFTTYGNGSKTNVILRDFSVDCNWSNQDHSGDAIDDYMSTGVVSYGNYWTINNLEVHDFGQYGGIVSHSAYSFITENEIYNGYYEDSSRKKWTIGIMQTGYGASKTTISHNYVHDIDGVGIEFEDEPSGCTCVGNIVVDCHDITDIASGITYVPAGIWSEGGRNTIIGNTVLGCTRGIVVRWVQGKDNESGYLNTVIGNTVKNSYWDGIYILGGASTEFTKHNIITGNVLMDNGLGGETGHSSQITLDTRASNNIISGNNLYLSVANVEYQISEIGTGTASNLIFNNMLTGTPTVANMLSVATTKVRNNIGWVTENSGTGTIANGATTATITHGLSVTPTLDDISITLGENPTNTPGAIFVTDLGATTFVVNCENDPGSSGLDFSWRAVVL
jgi:hypothetical protein